MKDAAHLTPFLDEIRNVFNARVDSQVVYFADIVDGINVGRNNVSFITPSQLETFIGRTKWNVGELAVAQIIVPGLFTWCQSLSTRHRFLRYTFSFISPLVGTHH